MTDTAAPLWTDYGPCYPWCEVGIGDIYGPVGLGRWDVSRWDAPDATWSGDEPAWLDVSCEVIDAACDRGRTSVTDRFRAGTAEVVFRNLDGWADLTDVVDPAALTLRPGRAIRFGVDTPTGRHVLFRGFIDEAVPGYTPAGADVTIVNAVDAFGEVARGRLPAFPTPQHGGDTVTTRIGRILDMANWPASKRMLEPSALTLLGTTYGTSVVDELSLSADSAGGSVFADTDASIVYRARDWQTYDPDTPPAGTITCDAQAWDLGYRRADAAAVAIFGNVDGLTVTRTDEATMLALGPEPFERTDLLTPSVDTLTVLADRALATRHVSTFPRVEAVTLDAANDRGDGTIVDVMAAARPEDATRYRCRLVQSGRVVFDVAMLTVSVRHTITGGGQWTARLGLDVAEPFAMVGGRWDSAGWDLDRWADQPAALTIGARP